MDQPRVSFFRLGEAEPAAPFEGIEMRGVFGAGACLNVVRLAPDAELPMHSHPHEQIGMVLEGVEILMVGDVEHRVGPHEAYVVPGGVEHGGRGGPDGCIVVDVFVPAREDYRAAAAPARADLGSG
jgi:quercetin dioxygenase-like cupin family protein